MSTYRLPLTAVITIAASFLINNLRYGLGCIEAYNQQLGDIDLKVLVWKLTQIPLCGVALMPTYRFR